MKGRRVRLFLRLTTDVNDRLRALMRYHGELSRYIDDARSANTRVRAAAKQRGCTVTALANSALDKWLGGRRA